MGQNLPDRRRRGWKQRRVLLAALVALGFGLLLIHPGLAQTATDDPTFMRQRGFRIPFHPEPGDNRTVQVNLYVSEDQGRTWVPAGKAPANGGGFNYQADHDGLYWFTVQTVDRDNRLYPASMQGALPQIKVYVKTTPPSVSLRATQFQDGLLKAEWQILDDYLRLDTLTLSWRPSSNYQWVPLNPPRTSAAGSQTWNPGTNAPVEVRLEVQDRAGNLGTQTTTSTSLSNSSTQGAGISQPVGTGDVRILNGRSVTLSYEIDGVGRSGIKEIEVWRTRQGGKWETDSTHSMNRTTDFQPVTIKLPDQDGTYGYTLTARSMAGLGEVPPRAGDPPQVWIEVDRTAPDVRISSVEVGKGADLGKLIVQYYAADKNFARQPIKLYYASAIDQSEQLDWKEMTSTPQDNNGRFVWNLPVDVPYLLWIKVEAVDRAGNVGTAVWGPPDKKPVNVDLSQPRVIFKEIRIADPAQSR